MNVRKLIAPLVNMATIVCASVSFAADILEPAKIDALAAPLVEGNWIKGAVVGLINEHGTQIVAYGQATDKTRQAPGADTLFEIGSITKVFTGLLLAQMAEEHLVDLNEPVQKLLGDSMSMPKSKREITLVDLATHGSGLPGMPTNFAPQDPTNPFADYTVEQLARFLAGHKLRRAPGEKSEYSNLGMGLLGHALALRSGMSYEALFRARICEPLAMSDTWISLDQERQARLAQGHDCDGEPVANWDLPTLAGAGAIRSTAADMLKFLAANMGLVKTPFGAAIQNAQSVHFEVPDGLDDVGLAWQIRRDGHVVWHNGGTGGYHTFAAIVPEKHVGVVVLANTASMHVDGLGFRLVRLLMGEQAKPPDLPRAIPLDAAEIEPYVGKYQLSPLVTVTVSRANDQLLVQLTGQPKVRFYPQSKNQFFCRAVDAAVSFVSGEDDKIQQLVIHQGGENLSAPKKE